jgi:hypothetical protein
LLRKEVEIWSVKGWEQDRGLAKRIHFALNTLRNAIRQLGEGDRKERGRTNEENKKYETMYDIGKF